MVNVLIFSHSSGLGSAERSLLTLVTDLIKDYNTQITVVLPPEGPSVELLNKAGATVLPAPIRLWCTTDELPNKEKMLESQSQTFDWLLEHLEELRSRKPDIILTNTIVIPWGALAAVLLKKPHIWMVNEFGQLDHGFNFFLPFTQVLGVIENASDVIVTRSNAIRETLFPHLDQEKARTIYRSIELPPGRSRLTEPAQAGSAFRMAVIGTIRESKGQQDAVEAVIELRNNRNRQVELVMAGRAEEPYHSALVQLAQENGIQDCIRILPFQEDVFSIMQQADVILLCSRIEAFGRVTLESMLLGKPVIGTNSGGTPELIKHGETGLLYEPGNISQLIEKIELLIDRPAYRQEIAQKGAEFARSTFTKEQYAGEFHKLMASITGQPYRDKVIFTQEFLNRFQELYLHKAARLTDIEARNKKLEQKVLFLRIQQELAMDTAFT